MTIFCSKIKNDFVLDKSFLQKINLEEKSEIVFEYISDFRSAKLLRDFLGELSEKLGIDKLWKSRLILIVDELNNNAIEYGSRIGDINTFTVKFKKNSNQVELNIEVEDTGKGEKHKTAVEMNKIKNKRRKNGFDNHNGIRGRGLFLIIDKLVDELYFKDSNKGGLIVGIKKVIEQKKED